MIKLTIILKLYTVTCYTLYIYLRLRTLLFLIKSLGKPRLVRQMPLRAPVQESWEIIRKFVVYTQCAYDDLSQHYIVRSVNSFTHLNFCVAVFIHFGWDGRFVEERNQTERRRCEFSKKRWCVDDALRTCFFYFGICIFLWLKSNDRQERYSTEANGSIHRKEDLRLNLLLEWVKLFKDGMRVLWRWVSENELC